MSPQTARGFTSANWTTPLIEVITGNSRKSTAACTKEQRWKTGMLLFEFELEFDALVRIYVLVGSGRMCMDSCSYRPSYVQIHLPVGFWWSNLDLRSSLIRSFSFSDSCSCWLSAHRRLHSCARLYWILDSLFLRVPARDCTLVKLFFLLSFRIHLVLIFLLCFSAYLFLS